MHAALKLGQRRICLERGVYRGGRERPGGALRVDGEGAQALHLVAPELHAQRVADGGVSVNEPAAHGVLAAAAHLLHALVAKRREPRQSGVEPHLQSGRERQGPRLQLERQEPLQQGHGLRHHDAAGGQRGKRLLALAHHVRRRRHVAAVEHTARRQHGDGPIEVEREVGGQPRGGVAVGRDHQPAGAIRLTQYRRQHVGGVETGRVHGRAAAQPRRGRRERLALYQVLKEHERPACAHAKCPARLVDRHARWLPSSPATGPYRHCTLRPRASAPTRCCPGGRRISVDGGGQRSMDGEMRRSR